MLQEEEAREDSSSRRSKSKEERDHGPVLLNIHVRKYDSLVRFDAFMRVSVPTIPVKLASASQNSRVQLTPLAAIERISDFLRPGNVALLTGAGVSVDSGIRAYRGPEGRYLNPNYKLRWFYVKECHELI